MKTLVFAPETYNLAETSRMIEIARACQSRFQIVFMAYGGMFEELIRNEGFVLREMAPRLTSEKIDHFYKVYKAEKIDPLFTVDELMERVNNEITLFNEVDPAALVTGYCLSTSISTRAVGIPLVSTIQSTWTPAYYEANLGTWPDMVDCSLMRWLPNQPLDRVYSKVSLPVGSFFLGANFNKVARKYGVRRLKSIELWEGDYALLAEPPEFSGLMDLPPHYRYIGPLIARLEREIPPEVLAIPRDQPIIYFAMGSSGNPEIIASIIEGFRSKPYRVIAPVRPLVQKMRIRVPPNVIVTDWLPAHKVNPMADVSVTHGGIGTIMTACLAGTPIVGVGMQPEQEANLECLVRKGFAIRIRKKRVTPGRILDAIDHLLTDREAHRRARAFQRVVAQWDGPSNAARFFAETFG